jgi:(1->4)-alpha-D-glucan 1-alpha-D-glucosylmutase
MAQALAPQATYRVQLNGEFGFDAAASLAPYLARLGISHLYCSPYLQAATGSMHGYDVVDSRKLSTELGGAPAHARMCAALAQHRLGQILDIVPNHMAIGSAENPFWWDVLENGPASRWASYFDVDWDPPESRLRNTVLLPVLGEQYGLALERGELRVVRTGAKFAVAYHERRFPVEPASLEPLLAAAATHCGSDELAFIAGSLGDLPKSTSIDRPSLQRRHRDQAVLEGMLTRLIAAGTTVASAVDWALAKLNADFDALHMMLEKQNYRLAFWRAAQRDLGYRRFFDISSLIGLRMEDPQVFNDTHALILQFLAGGILSGVRVDHIDGLRDPADYLTRLRHAAPGAWIVVEKILEPGEELRAWPVAGTTGYDFMNQVCGLFVDAAGEAPLTHAYAEFIGEEPDLNTMVREAKETLMSDTLGSELGRLTALFLEVCEANRRYRDYSRHDLHEALRAVVARFAVYRTYVREGDAEPDPEDVRYVTQAVAAAKRDRTDLEPRLLDFLGDVLLLRYRGKLETELALRFQQFTGPVMAKALEDTVFYRYHRLICLNEVGGDPSRFGLTAAAFHRACEEAGRRWPLRMLATSTHDTKRSGDVRARLCLLSEIPEQWRAAVARWAEMNGGYWSGRPDRNFEYLLYQTLVGAWPIAIDRMLSYATKAIREAKQWTSWTNVNRAYEAAVTRFVEGVMANRGFIADLEAFTAPLIPLGRINSLAQTLIKMTAPGVPDFYQGTELWNLSLVDPDNRRPVDYALHQRLLGEIEQLSASETMRRADEGLPKLWLVQRTLNLRKTRGELFSPDAIYSPLEARGTHAAHVVAFARGKDLIAVVPRLPTRLGGGWGDTHLHLPQGNWRNELAGERFAAGAAAIGDLLLHFPVGLMVREEAAA